MSCEHVLGSPGMSDWGRKVLPLRRQAEVQTRWLLRRLETVLPEVMRREGFDMWIVAGREYNEDPVLLTLLPPTAISARRRTILIFFILPSGQLERLSLSRAGSGYEGVYQGVWDQFKEDQWEAVGRLVRERGPKRIAIDVSGTFAFGDGLSHSEFQELSRALGPEMMTRTAGAERLAVGWLERRTDDELASYPGIVEIAHGVVAEGFSSRVVHPGVTSSADVAWWMRQRMEDAGLPAWFQPSVSAQRRGMDEVGQDAPLLPGDVLHCDMGFRYLGLCTDCQQLAYILAPGETGAPAGLKRLLKQANRLQELTMGEYVGGRTGNEILSATLSAMRAEGIDGCLYTHPLGFHGHGAGPTIGLFDHQEGVPGRGDYQLFEDTCYALELNAKAPVPEWGGQEVRAALEEDVVFAGGKARLLDGRQTEFHLIR